MWCPSIIYTFTLFNVGTVGLGEESGKIRILWHLGLWFTYNGLDYRECLQKGKNWQPPNPHGKALLLFWSFFFLFLFILHNQMVVWLAAGRFNGQSMHCSCQKLTTSLSNHWSNWIIMDYSKFVRQNASKIPKNFYKVCSKIVVCSRAFSCLPSANQTWLAGNSPCKWRFPGKILEDIWRPYMLDSKGVAASWQPSSWPSLSWLGTDKNPTSFILEFHFHQPVVYGDDISKCPPNHIGMLWRAAL